MTASAPADGSTGAGGPADHDAPAPARSWAFLRRPAWIAAILGAVVFAALCWTVLAPWQFGRNLERSTANRQIEAAAGASPRPVEELLSTNAEPQPAASWQPVTAAGAFLPELQVYVRLRQDADGQPASEVVVPFRLDDGTVVLVDRGYVSIGALTDPLPPLPLGPITVTGRVQPDQPDPLDRAPTRTDDRTEVLGISATGIPGLSGPVLRGFIQLTEGSPGVLRAVGVPQTDEGPFLSYALQWCAFGAMALLAVGYFVIREHRDPRVDDDPGRRPAGRDTGRPGRFDRSELYDRGPPD